MHRLAALILIPLFAVGCGSGTPTGASKPAAHKANRGAHVPAGSIRFGHSLKQLDRGATVTAFKMGQPIVWVAHFTAAPSSTDVRWEIYRGQGPGPSAVFSGTAPTAGVHGRVVASSLSGSQLTSDHLNKTDPYTMVYYGSKTVLARGHFDITR